MVNYDPFILALFATPRAKGHTSKAAKGIWVVNAFQAHDLGQFWGWYGAEELQTLGQSLQCILGILQVFPPCPGLLDFINLGV